MFLSILDANPAGAFCHNPSLCSGAKLNGPGSIFSKLFRNFGRKRRFRISKMVQFGKKTGSIHPRGTRRPLGVEHRRIRSNFSSFQPEVVVADTLELRSDRPSKVSADDVVANVVCRDGRGRRVRRRRQKFWRQKFELRSGKLELWSGEFAASSTSESFEILFWKVKTKIINPLFD